VKILLAIYKYTDYIAVYLFEVVWSMYSSDRLTTLIRIAL